jgi:hypothetical protein
MNPLRWIARNQTIAQILGIGIFCLISFGIMPFRRKIGLDTYELVQYADMAYLILWVTVYWYARHKYAPETLPKDGIPTNWRLVYSIGAAGIILLTWYLMQTFHLFQ